MSILCWFRPCRWYYLGAFEQADPTFTPGVQGQRGLYQCVRCKTMSVGSPIDPENRSDDYDAEKHAAAVGGATL